MALFGKKKNAEPAAPQLNAEDEIQVMGGDADETDIEDHDGGQAIDFDAIADELDDDEGHLNFSKSPATQTAPFAADTTFEADGASTSTDDGLDFDSVFDDGSAENSIPTSAPVTDENPFGAPMASTPIDVPTGGIAIEPVNDTSPLTHTAPLLTSDAVATAGVPATRKSLPLLPLLGAAGLLVALGVVGYTVFGAKPAAEEPVVAANPSLQSPTGEGVVPGGPMTVPGGPTGAVNPGIAVDGVPIAPGPIMRSALAPAGPSPTVPLTPALLKQLKDLWKQGADAKNARNIAGARTAWQKMLQLRPNHPGVQSAIDKLPAA